MPFAKMKSALVPVPMPRVREPKNAKKTVVWSDPSAQEASEASVMSFKDVIKYKHAGNLVKLAENRGYNVVNASFSKQGEIFLDGKQFTAEEFTKHYSLQDILDYKLSRCYYSVNGTASEEEIVVIENTGTVTVTFDVENLLGENCKTMPHKGVVEPGNKMELVVERKAH